ncbi:MAG: T9SS type A sorting domain-containing protein [Candidatus Kapabacteria bacterium]|nr:T9SS type A sorting domain-containing protein [Candidatus Kapabacteria bacterium]
MVYPYDEIVWEVKTPGQIYDVAYHPNGESVFVLNDGVVQMYSVANGTLIKEFARELQYSLSKMAISKDGSMVAVITLAEYDHIIIFNTETGKEIMRFRDTISLDKPDNYNSVAFSPDGKFIITTGTHYNSYNNFSTVLLVEISSGKIQALNKSYYSKIDPNFPYNKFQNFTRAIYSNNGLNIFTISTNNIRLEKYDVKDLSQKEVLMDGGYITPSDDDNFLKQTRTGKYLLISSAYNYGVFNLSKKAFDLSLSKRIGLINSLTLDAKDSILINEEQYGVKVRNFYTKDIMYSYHLTYMRSCDISPNDSLLITGILDTLRIIKFKIDIQSSVKNSAQNILPIYPNPSKENFSIPLNCSELGSEVKVISNSGKLVYNQLFENSIEESLNIDCSKWANGAYFVQVICNNQTKNYKVIIE